MSTLQEENEELLKGRQAALFEFKKEVEHKKKAMSSGKVDNVGMGMPTRRNSKLLVKVDFLRRSNVKCYKDLISCVYNCFK